MFASVCLISVTYLSFFLITDGAAGIKHFPEIINWRFTDPNEVSYIETLFSTVINDNAPIKYHTGRRKGEAKPHEIKTFDLGADGPTVWILCDAVDIKMMGMTALDTNLNIGRDAKNKGFTKVCRLVDMLQLYELPARSVYILISDRHENIIDSYLFNSIEMEEKKDDYEEYQKSYGLTLGAIVS
jgi:hypothetical protein